MGKRFRLYTKATSHGCTAYIKNFPIMKSATYTRDYGKSKNLSRFGNYARFRAAHRKTPFFGLDDQNSQKSGEG